MKSSTYEKKLKLLEDEIKRTNPRFKNKLRQMKEEAEKLRVKFEEKKRLEEALKKFDMLFAPEKYTEEELLEHDIPRKRAKIISYSEPKPEPERDFEWPEEDVEYVRPCREPYYCKCGDWVTEFIQHQGSWVCPNCLCGIDE